MTSYRRPYLDLAIVAFLFFSVHRADAVTKNFTGAGSTDWFNAGNWDPSGVPTSADDVTISNKTVALNADATVTTFTLNGGLTLSGSDKYLDGRTLTNNGSAIWSGGNLHLWNGAVLNNPVGSTIDVRGDVTLSTAYGAGTVNNTGTLLRTTGIGAATIQQPLNNSGSIDVQSGTLVLYTGTSTGPIDATGAILR